jgi:uncharacterized membrane protein YkvA (DUF1232 family)
MVNTMKDQKAGWLSLWKKKARDLEMLTTALVFAYRDPRTPWYAKAFVAVIVAYAFSPIDLIPDFIPVLGYLDDFIIIPFGVTLALKMIPAEVMEESKIKAAAHLNDQKPQYRFMILVVALIWIVVIGLIATAVVRKLEH